ncbi:MAG: ABC transporter permease, partial [Candidatus Sericytochromatia bacterium]|nr:ABC transporter permease [Candidatus Tanganyikabacteria bacterium]
LALPAVIPLDGMKINGSPAHGRALAEAWLSFAQFIAIFLAISAAAGLVAHDLDRGTGLLLLSKPLRRWQILLGKWLGAAAFMAVAWLVWGLIAAAAFAYRLDDALFGPAMAAFAASMVASWLIVAFCLFWSCWLPSNAVMGLSVVGWILATSAPQVAGFVDDLGHKTLARVLRGVGEGLPFDKLSSAARSFVSGDDLDIKILWSVGFIAAWWCAAAVVFARRDLAAGS